MQSKAATVEEYIREASDQRRPYLQRLRQLCLECLPGFTEEMAYGMAVYRKSAEDGAAFANQKQYISLYIHEDVVRANRAALAGLSVGKVCIRFPNPKKMDFELIRQLLEETRHAASAVF